jgi:16S rRNA (guanine1207-N2)-methyltransferase
MTRWANDPDGAADELIRRGLESIDLRGRILFAGQAGTLPSLLAGRGIAFEGWSRRLVAGGTAAPWPQAGSFDLALLRLPRAKTEQEMAAHACLGVLAPGGRLVIYGGNDEGIRSFAGVLAALCGAVDTLAARGHGRIVAARRPVSVSALRTSLAAWRSVVPLAIGGAVRDWVCYPGVFAADRIDEGTALLIGALPPLQAGARVLDYGCGSGAIGAAALAQQPAIALDLIDNDAVALEAARKNVAGATVILGRCLADAGRRRYDAILSNPPLHKGFAEDHGELGQLIADAPGYLKPGGVLQLVVQRRLALDRLLGKHFASVSVPAQNGRYRVWRASSTGPSPPAA